nr:hypothetical protein [Okeania sp. SIO2F4]
MAYLEHGHTCSKSLTMEKIYLLLLTQNRTTEFYIQVVVETHKTTIY